jgi:hypothetical protein
MELAEQKNYYNSKKYFYLTYILVFDKTGQSGIFKFQINSIKFTYIYIYSVFQDFFLL